MGSKFLVILIKWRSEVMKDVGLYFRTFCICVHTEDDKFVKMSTVLYFVWHC